MHSRIYFVAGFRLCWSISRTPQDDERREQMELMIYQIINTPRFLPRQLRSPALTLISEVQEKMATFKEKGGTFVTAQVEREFIWILKVKEHLRKAARVHTIINGPVLGRLKPVTSGGDWAYDHVRTQRAPLCCVLTARSVRVCRLS